jgi:hypothetical protein
MNGESLDITIHSSTQGRPGIVQAFGNDIIHYLPLEVVSMSYLAVCV